MKQENYNVIGVMSGTSLDGIDLAHVSFAFSQSGCAFLINETQTVAYSAQWQARLKKAIELDHEALDQIDIDYTRMLGNEIRSFIEQHDLAGKIEAVCSHGHTVLHRPAEGLTLQIGNRPQLAQIIGMPVVCDFRVQDVAMGGQGAPLVPVGDRILFADYDYCLNLGGFSNLSYEKSGFRQAFDISPVNTVLNHYAEALGLTYDDRGRIAQSGKINHELLLALNRIEFYDLKPPKSLGQEFVRDVMLPILGQNDLAIADILCTFCEHVAIQIAAAVPKCSGKMLVTGGGAYHDFLISRMQHHLDPIALVIPDGKTIEYKEALIFGLLGVLRLREEINVLSSVTGAKEDHCAGYIYS
jgi:anhydro-N-acetylmuramic acid kinase